MIMPKKYFFDKNGNPLAYGKVYTYQAGTTINKETFTTEGGTVANTNPVILNGEGYASIYINGSYNIVVDDLNDNNIWTEDPVSSNIAEEWVNCQSPLYVSQTSFTIIGNYTSDYQKGKRVRIDNDVAEFSYSTIVSSSFAGGLTTVVISNPVVQVGVLKVCVSIVTDNSIDGYVKSSTLAEASENALAEAGDVVHISDRGNALFEYKEGEAPNEMDIVTCTGVPSLSLVLDIGDKAYIDQLGAPTDGTGNPTPYIEHAFTLRDTISYGGSQNTYDITEVVGIPVNGIYSEKTFRITSEGATVYPSVVGEAIYTSATAKADPESTANLFTAKILCDQINYVPKTFTPFVLPTFDGRIFNADRLYNTLVYNCNFAYIERVVDSRRKKGTDSFSDEGYIQSFLMDSNNFAYCNYIVQFSYGYNTAFTNNTAEACQWGWHSVFDAGTLLTGRFINNLFEGIGVYLKIPSAKGCILHGAHLEMGNAPAASYLASKALIDLSPAGPISASEVSRQWDIRGVFGSVPLIYDGDDFEFSLISTTNATYPNVKSPEITFSALSYRAEHLVFSQGSEVGSPSEATNNMLRNANFQINQNERLPTSPVVTGKEIDLWTMRSAADAAPITTYTAGFDRGGAYGGSHSFTLAGATKSHFMNQFVPMRRNIINGIGGVAGTRVFITLNMSLPAETLMRVKVSYTKGPGIFPEFGDAQQFINIQAGTRVTHFSFTMPKITRTDDSDYGVYLQVTFNGAAGDGTPPADGTYKIFFEKLEFNSIFATPFISRDYKADLLSAREVYYRPKGGAEIISCRQAASSVLTTTKTMPLTSMNAASYTVTYSSIDLYLGGVLTNVVSGPGVTFDGHSIKVSHNGGATFNGYEKINGLTITAD